MLNRSVEETVTSQIVDYNMNNINSHCRHKTNKISSTAESRGSANWHYRHSSIKSNWRLLWSR